MPKICLKIQKRICARHKAQNANLQEKVCWRLSTTIENLIEKAACDDRAAFSALYSETSGTIFAVVLMILKKPELAEEVAQEVYIKAWQNAGRFCQEKGSGMAWLTTIARRTAIDRIRANQRETAGKGYLQAEIDLMASEKMRGDDALVEDVWRCLKAQDDESAKLISLAFFAGYTHEELAADTGKALGTVKSRIRRGLMSLKTCLGV